MGSAKELRNEVNSSTLVMVLCSIRIVVMVDALLVFVGIAQSLS